MHGNYINCRHHIENPISKSYQETLAYREVIWHKSIPLNLGEYTKYLPSLSIFIHCLGLMIKGIIPRELLKY